MNPVYGDSVYGFSSLVYQSIARAPFQ